MAGSNANVSEAFHVMGVDQRVWIVAVCVHSLERAVLAHAIVLASTVPTNTFEDAVALVRRAYLTACEMRPEMDGAAYGPGTQDGGK